MNEEDVSKVLGQVVPEAPSPDAWAGAAVRRSRRRRRGAVAAVAALAIVAVPVGAMVVSKPPSTAVPAAPGGEVTGDVLIFGTAEEPELCLGAVRESYPPQCGGPSLKGDFDWAQVVFEEEGGARWTNQSYTVRGFYDPDDGDGGSFTLTAPVVLAPEGEPDELDFPQLCDDPLVGSPPGTDPVEQQAFAGALDLTDQTLPVVFSWATGSTYNYLVQGDAEAAFQEMRAVFDGGLCVRSSDAPTQARRMEVADKVMTAVPTGQLISSDAHDYSFLSAGTEMTPSVGVRVVIATPEIEAAVRKAAQEVPVTLTAVFTPVAPDTPTRLPSVDPTASATPATSDLPATDPASSRASDLPLRLRTLSGTQRILQEADGPARLCLKDAWEATEPFSCEGPILMGDVDWDEIPHTTDQGVRVSDQHYTVTGEYDPTDGEFGSLTLDGPPVAAGQPGVELVNYSALCDPVDASWWPPMVSADGDASATFVEMSRRVCDRLTGPVAEDKLDSVLSALPSVRDAQLIGYSRNGNDLVVKVLAADDRLMDMVFAAVEEAGMPVAVRTGLTPPGEQDTTLVAPSR